MIKRNAVLFPGQGSQSQGILTRLIERFPSIKGKLADLLGAAGCNTNPEAWEKEANWNSSVTAHIAIVAAGIASWNVLTDEHSVKADLLAGHSLGEITALACSKTISDEYAMRLARARGEAMEKASLSRPSGMMAVIGLGCSEVEGILAEYNPSGRERIWLANINLPDQVVIAGELSALEEIERPLKMQKARVVRLPTAGAFHTPIMRPAADEFSRVLERVKWHEPQIPIVSSRTGRLITNPGSLRIHLTLQLIQPVIWVSVMEFLMRSGISQVFEVAPAGVLSGLAKRFGFSDIDESFRL